MSTEARQPVAKLHELADGSITRIERDSGAIVLVRDGEQVVALSATCPHAGASLEDGALCHGRLICPWHKATFDLGSGALLEPPALEGLQRYALHVDGDAVYVDDVPEPIKRVRPYPVDRGSSKTFAIIGAGAAGAAACATLREYGFDGRILLIDVETMRPYDRTTLSKFVPSGELKPDDVYPLLPEGFLTTHRIEGVNRRVASLDPQAREIELDDGETLRYDAALIATGSVPVHPPIAGLTDERVAERTVFLRSLVDARELDALASQHRRALIIGGSFIGLETASALRKRGIDVTVVMPHALPFEKQFGSEAARRIKRLHEANGARFRTETKVESVEWREAAVLARLDNGDPLECDFIVVGTGVQPATEFLKHIRRHPDGGIDVEASMRVTDTLFAAGDVAAFPVSGDKRARIEHWRVAQQQARIAAINMAGFPVEPPIVPFFWTYHCDKRFDYLGHAEPGDWSETRTVGSLERLEFITLYACDGKVVAALGCDKEAGMAFLAERMREPLSLDEAIKAIG